MNLHKLPLVPLDFSCYGIYFNHVQMKVSFDHSFIIWSQLVCKANISSQIKNIKNNSEMYLICCSEEDCLNPNRSWVEWTIVINILDSLSKEETYMLLRTQVHKKKDLICLSQKMKKLHNDSPRKPICSHCTKCRNY